MVFALVLDLQGLAVVARALADLALDVDIGQEVHLDPQDAVPLAGLAAPALDVEGEAPRLVAAHLRLGQLGEQVADIGKDAGVGGRVGARRAADRRLVDVDDLVELLEPDDGVNRAGALPGAVESLGQGLVQGVEHQGRFSRPGDPGDAGHDPQGDVHVNVLEVVGAGPPDAQLPRGLAARCRQRDRQAAGQVVAGQRVGMVEDLLGGPLGDHLAAMDAGTRPHVDHMIGLENGLLVVLHHQHGVAEVAQPLEGVEQPPVVALVQADGRLVEDVEDADQRGADLGRQADALALTAGEGAGGPVEGQVIKADIDQEREPFADLLENPPGDFRLLGGKLELGEESLPHRSRSASRSRWMLRPPIRTQRVSGLRRAPWQLGQGMMFMNCSSFSRVASDSVSRRRRSRLGITPSKGLW